jgi:hypothetical protein
VAIAEAGEYTMRQHKGRKAEGCKGADKKTRASEEYEPRRKIQATGRRKFAMASV